MVHLPLSESTYLGKKNLIRFHSSLVLETDSSHQHHNQPFLLSVRYPFQRQRHAEIRFIDKINSLNLNPSQSYKIICYITWSPCPNCASELVDFITRNDHLNLQIFASRLYFHWIKPFWKGLQKLQKAGISVAVMTHTGRKRDRAVSGLEVLQVPSMKGTEWEREKRGGWAGRMQAQPGLKV